MSSANAVHDNAQFRDKFVTMNHLQIHPKASFWRLILLALTFAQTIGVDGLCLPSEQLSRRSWFKGATRNLASAATAVAVATTDPKSTKATDATQQQRHEEEQFDPNDPEFKELYENPAIPPAPEERSGLVVLRVAEVAQFQEKILRAVESGELKGVMVSPMQFAFGTQILLRNSGLDSNIRLMIDTEISKQNRPLAIKNAVNAMNTLQDIATFSASIQRDFEKEEMIQLAEMYKLVRINLNQLYEYLPEKEKEKYYGYFVAVTGTYGMVSKEVGPRPLLQTLTRISTNQHYPEYEKKIAEGVYNPDIDGVLKLEY